MKYKIVTKESRLVMQILRYLQAKGLKAGKVKTHATLNKKGSYIKDRWQLTGMPDIFAFDTERKVMYGLEVKAGNNKQTPNQIYFQALFHQPPSRIYSVVKSIDDVIEVIDKRS